MRHSGTSSWTRRIYGNLCGVSEDARKKQSRFPRREMERHASYTYSCGQVIMNYINHDSRSVNIIKQITLFLLYILIQQLVLTTPNSENCESIVESLDQISTNKIIISWSFDIWFTLILLVGWSKTHSQCIATRSCVMSLKLNAIFFNQRIWETQFHMD